MPTAGPSNCTEPGCGTKTTGGPCALHRRQKDRQRVNRDVRRLYHTARWQRLRKALFEADPLCALCREEGRVQVWTDLDHTKPHRGDLGLFWDVLNLQGLCARHHHEKTAQGG